MALYTAVSYCNLTSDLSRAYAKIHGMYRGQRTLAGVKPHTTENIFKVARTGYVEAMYEDGVKMSVAADLSSVNAAQEYFWDSTNDVLYFYPTGGQPANHIYVIGENPVTAKTDAVAIASRDAEALLDAKFSIPVAMSLQGTATQPYDRDFAHAVALLACGHLLQRIEPADFQYDGTGLPVGATNDTARLILEGQRIIREFNSGSRRFSWEITADEVAGHNIIPQSTNTSAGMIQLRGGFQPDTLMTGSLFDDDLAIVADPFWLVKINAGGAVGTATFSVSRDNGSTYSSAAATSNGWTHISNNVWVRFVPRLGAAGDFITNDTWQVELNAPGREPTGSSIRSVPVEL